jgi:hypothetical protein
MRRFTFAVIALCVSTVSLAAHDLWIHPSSFVPEMGRVVGVRLRIGEDLVGEPLPRDPALIERFVVQDPAGRRDLLGRDGADPAGLLRVTTPGLHVIGYQSRPRPIVLSGEKFTQYLKEEGLDRIVALRAARRQTNALGRESFARSARSLVLAGAASPDQRDRPLGLPLELVAERNPFLLSAGDTLPVRLLFRGVPLSGALVTAINRQHPAAKVSARTDGDGRVQLELAGAGMWLIKTVHMIEAAAGGKSEWESYWASVTLEF